MTDDLKELVEKMMNGDRPALARLITMVENRTPQVQEIMKSIYPVLGKAATIGITGPPGAGKSTLANCLIEILREKGQSVGVVAVDPSSSFSGGAILGDRIRMKNHSLDKGVFIRSLSTRGHKGGISRTTDEVVHLLDAGRFDWIIIETVGVGQTELDIMEIVDTTIVVLVPESGDTIQTMKAGLMEIADIFAVNKSDRDGADSIYGELMTMVSLYPSLKMTQWTAPVLKVQANKNIGIEDLVNKVDEHRAVILQDEALQSRRQKNRKSRFFEILSEVIQTRATSAFNEHSEFSAYLEKVVLPDTDPYTAALEIIRNKRFWELVSGIDKKPGPPST